MARKVIGLAKNAVGRPGSTRRRWALWLSLVILVGAGAVVMQPLLAVHDDGVFELDRNTVDAADPGEDWNTIYAASMGGVTAANAFAFITDNAGGANDTTIATGGGTKDDLDIPGWQFGSGNPVDKDDLLTGYAARYGDALYFGADRYAGNGSAQMGVWFFQEEVGPDPDNPGHFTGQHQDGDILVLSDFTNGGSVTNIRVFEWEVGGPINGTLRFLAGSADIPADCVGAPPKVPPVGAGDPFCATVNAAAIDVPWPFFPKGAKGAGPFQVPPGQFYEGGIDLAFLGLDDQCFASFIIETRSSPSIDAVLKDFVGGGFQSCETTLSTTASRHGVTNTIASGNGADSGTISSGTDTATLTIEGVATWQGDLNFYICGPIPSGVCDENGVLVDTKTVNQSSTFPGDFTSDVADAVTLTSAGRYCWFVTFTPDADSASRGVEGAEHDGSENTTNTECFTVQGVLPVLDTQAVASSVVFGGTIQDNATITGLAKEPGNNGSNTTYPTIGANNGIFVGKIVFSLVGPGDCTTIPSGFVNIDQAILSTAGNGTYGPVGFVVDTPNTPGVYHWKAQYQTVVVAVNNSSTSTHNATCTDTDEDVTVAQIPTQISTSPFTFPQDTASVKANTGNLPQGGTIEFKLYNSSANCTANTATGLLYSESKAGPANSTTAEHTVSTNNTTFSVNASSANDNVTLYWRVTYTPGGSAHTGRSSTCVESTLMDHTAHAYPGS